jgi:hypothetical protein
VPANGSTASNTTLDCHASFSCATPHRTR